MENTEGVHAAILEAEPADNCLVLIDTAAYAQKGRLLARKARELGIPVIIVTDRFSHFAYELTDLVLQMHTYIKTSWDSTASLTIILNLPINHVAIALGDSAEERFPGTGRAGFVFSGI